MKTNDAHRRQPADGPTPSDDGAALPADRDARPDDAASPDPQHHANRAPIRQAHRDVESGIKDTERIGTPNDVPTSGNGPDAKR